jgi:hypothetical protein
MPASLVRFFEVFEIEERFFEMLDSLAAIDAMLEKASQPRQTTSAKKYAFLFLKPDQEAMIRPLFEMNNLIILKKHYLYNNQSPRDSLDAICASETGQDCKLCNDAQNNKKLTADSYVYLPVYVYGVREKVRENGAFVMKNGNPVTRVVQMKEWQEDNTQIEKPLKGFFLLEMNAQKVTGQILKAMRAYARNPKYNHSICGCDYLVAQEGSGQDKTYVITPEPLKPAHPEIAKRMPDINQFHQMILDTRPPVVIQASGVTADSDDFGSFDNLGGLENEETTEDFDADHPF